MPFTPSKLAQRRVKTTFQFNGEPMSVEYYPAALSDDSLKQRQALTGKLQGAMKRLADTPEEQPEERAAIEAEIESHSLAMAEWIITFFCGWDYFEDTGDEGVQGPMVPLTPDRLLTEMERYPDFVASCVLAILHDFQEGNANGAASSVRSGATYSPTAPSMSSMVGRSRKK